MSRLAAWRDFHVSNPDVFYLFIRFARQAKAAGKKTYSARAIGERIRWEVEIVTRSSEEFKINDHHWPYYSRLAMLTCPELAGFFERRDSHFDGTDSELLNAHKSRIPAAPAGQLF